MAESKIDELIESYVNDVIKKHPHSIAREKIAEKTKKMAELEKEISKLKLEISSLANSPQAFLRIEKLLKTKRYKNAVANKKLMRDLSIRLSDLEVDLNDTKNTIKFYENQLQEKFPEETVKLEEITGDKRKAVLHMCKDNPQCGKSKEFMKRAVEINPFVIEYDETDDPQLYVKYITIILEDKSKMIGQNDLLIDALKKKELAMAREEILNPSQVKDGMYKVPHRYLFEALRIGAHMSNDSKYNDYSMFERIAGTFCMNGTLKGFDNLDKYFALDGNISDEQGKKFEELYEGENFIFQHMYLSKEGSGKFVDAYINGKKESAEQIGNMDLQYTFTGKYLNNAGFCALFAPDERNRIIASIPKKAFVKDSQIPIWGKDSTDLPAFLLPEYIIGMIPGKSNQLGEFITNIVDKKKKHTYQHLYNVKREEVARKKDSLEDEVR